MYQALPIGILLRLFTYIAGAAGILFFFTYVPDQKSFLSRSGKFSLTIYLAHSFCLSFLKKSFLFNHPLYVLIASLVISALICLLFGNSLVFDAYRFVLSIINDLLFQKQNDSSQSRMRGATSLRKDRHDER